LLDRLRAAFRIERRAASGSLADPWTALLLGFSPTASGITVSTETALRCPAVYGAVKVLAESVAQLPVHLYRLLRRIIGTTQQTWFDVTCQASVRGYRPEELIGGMSQTDSRVVLSPTPLFDQQWAGSIPIANDRAIIQGRVRTVQFVNPIYINGELVRIEMNVRG
jgi:hypothetical protein